MDRSVTCKRLFHMSSQLQAAALATSLRRLTHACKANFNPNQPRVPAGNPDGGQWTEAGRSSAGGGQSTGGRPSRHERTDSTEERSSSDYHIVQLRESSSGIIRIADAGVPGIAIERFDKTGDALVDKMTEILLNRASAAHVVVGEGAGPLYGVNVHMEFARGLRSQNLPGVEIEQSFSAGDAVRYGLDGSIRTDVIFRSGKSGIAAIWDLKTGSARLAPWRAREIRREVGVGSEVPVIELHIRRGVRNKCRQSQGLSLNVTLNSPIELEDGHGAWSSTANVSTPERHPVWVSRGGR
jgi:hypothetical protein